MCVEKCARFGDSDLKGSLRVCGCGQSFIILRSLCNSARHVMMEVVYYFLDSAFRQE